MTITFRRPSDHHGSSMSQDRQFYSIISSLISKFNNVFGDIELHRRLLGCQQDDAQRVLNTFQALLDTPHMDPTFRRKVIVATQRISANTGIYPTCHELKNVILEGERAVAAGGFADVYKGKFEEQTVCLKAIRIYQNSEQEGFLKRFSRESIIWGQLSHPNLLPNYGLFRFRNRVCLVSPWMKGGDVTTYLRQRPDVSRVRLAVDIAEGLLYLHKNGIIHGNLKGPNILINDTGRACLADFGISSITDSEVLAWASHSPAASTGGSARWQAPELLDVEINNIVKNTEASDVYACACVFYEIFVGLVPFAKFAREATVIAKIQSGARPSRPSGSSPAWSEWGLTEDIWLLLERCWHPVPSERPSINEILVRLRRGLHEDRRPSARGSVWSPAHFRNRMRGLPDVMSAAELDAMLHRKSNERSRDLFAEETVNFAIGIDLNPTSSFGTEENAALPLSSRPDCMANRSHTTLDRSGTRRHSEWIYYSNYSSPLAQPHL